MPLILQGATSGQATVQATDAATVTLTLPATSGTLVTTGGAQTIEFADGSASAPSITNSGDTNTGMFFPAADTIAFTEGGVESMRIDSAGFVGIGCTPVTNLQVNASSDVGIAMSNSSSVTSGNRGTIYAYNSGTSTVGYIRFGAVTDNVGTDIQFGTRPAGGSITERMRITSAGDVGIGATSITNNKLLVKGAHVSGGAVLGLQTDQAATGSPIYLGFFNSSNTRIAYVGPDTATNFQIVTAESVPMIFGTADTERMRIDLSGRVFFATTNTAPSINNVYGVVLNSTGDGNYAAGVAQFSANGSAAINLNRGSDDGQTMSFRRSGTQVGNIVVTTSTTAYNTSSDYRLKENVAPMAGALARVSALKPVTYKWKVDGSDGEGFIAHELAEVVPNAVSGQKDAMRTERYEVSPAIPATFDEEGNELTPAVEAVMGEREVPDYQGIDTSFLVATLTAAIQELKATVDAQAARIAALEGAK